MIGAGRARCQADVDQRGFVAGRRRTAARDAAADFFAATRPVPLTLARARAFFFATILRRAAAARVRVVDAPVDTRVECFARCRTTRFGAASAIDVALNATRSARSSSFAWRIMALR
jgi:hypothetical protein